MSEQLVAEGARSVRGEAYPGITLAQAVKRVKEFYDKERKAAAPLSSAARAWEYSEKSSGVRITAAALISFGLLRNVGSGAERKLQLTERGLDIALDTDRKAVALRGAATSPKIYADILKHWPELPSDHTIRVYLLRDRNFNPNTVDDIVRDFKASIAYAKVLEPANMPSSAESKNDAGTDQRPDAKDIAVGDLIQWEIDGLLQLDRAKRVRAIKEYEGAFFVFVDGSETGIPMNEAVVERKGEKVITPPTLPLDPPLGDKVTVAPAEREWLRGPLSRDVGYRLIVTGDMGAKELGKLIKLLEAQKAVLAEDDDATDVV